MDFPVDLYLDLFGLLWVLLDFMDLLDLLGYPSTPLEVKQYFTVGSLRD